MVETAKPMVIYEKQKNFLPQRAPRVTEIFKKFKCSNWRLEGLKGVFAGFFWHLRGFCGTLLGQCAKGYAEDFWR